MDRTVHVRIHGHSMWPTYEDQQIVAFQRIEEGTVPAEGSVVLAQHPFKSDVKVVKRIRHVTDDGRLFLEGDQPDPLGSEDSHNFGPVQPKAIIAVAEHEQD